MFPGKSPPSVPAPIPSYRRWWSYVMGPWLVVGFIHWATRYIDTDPHQVKPKSEAIRKMVIIRDALFEFDRKYGGFPDAATIEKVRQDSKFPLRPGTGSSNDYLRQLVAVGLVEESNFVIESKHTREPDGEISGDKALEPGECSFAYLLGWSDASFDPDFRPVIFGPVVPGAQELDKRALKGDFMMMHVNGAIQSMRIRKDGKIHFGGGVMVDLTKPEWNGRPLTIAWPE